MELKRFQTRVDEEVSKYLHALASERERGNVEHAAMDAWRKEARRREGLDRHYEERRNGLDEDLPTFCIKVPTGGGKTLLATQILGSIYRTILADRRGAGLALWVVPSSQIYRDTLKRLSDRRDLYRVMLEHAVSRRIEIWEKDQIHRLTPARLSECLNILVFQLASTNRETKEQLKFFRDSGGSIVQHFPAEDDLEAHRELRRKFPNLEVIPETDLLKTSVGNLVRLCRPPVILDEGHRATSELAQSTIEGFNASIVVELSATPHQGANVLSRVSGEELLDEEMIKLPLNIATSGVSDWKALVTRAKDKRQSLQKKAEAALGESGDEKLIRPIVLVQVERTGKEQRGAKAGGKLLVHSEDVREFLTQRLGVSSEAVKVKTSEDDGLEDVDLMDPECPVEWIITKSALQEGWDCPFAYILVSLNNTGSAKAMTQLVGRVLRQPYQKRLPDAYAELNESYVYCLHQSAGEIAKQVKKALEEEGYEGDLSSVVRNETDGPTRNTRQALIRRKFADLYRREFDGKIYLPRFCVKDGREYAPLDYFEHLVSRVRVEDFRYGEIQWDLSDALKDAKDRYYSITLGSSLTTERISDIDWWESDEQVLAWLVTSLRFDYLSFKQLRRVVEGVYERLTRAALPVAIKDQMALVKTEIRNRIEKFVQGEIDRQTHAAFDRLFDEKRIQFYLECKDCRFTIPDSVTIESVGPLTGLAHDDGSPLERSLFNFVEHEGQNQYERKVALCLDRHADVLWWYRNRVGPGNFAIQGYKRERMYPDFVVQGKPNGREFHHVFVVESKGEHLQGNVDTEYKRDVAKYFTRAGKRVSWQKLGEDFKNHVFRFQILDETSEHGHDWQDKLKELLASGT
jgi:type III restriction enzyme